MKKRFNNQVFSTKVISSQRGCGARHPRRRAFTLIELLVVIAIISLLVSILLPSLQKAKQLTRDVICASNLRNIGLGWYFYLNDNNDTFPMWRQNLHWMYGGKHPSIFNNEAGMWALDFRPLNQYVELSTRNEAGIGLFRCPSDREISNNLGVTGGTKGYTTYEFFGNSYLLNRLLTVVWNDDFTQIDPMKNFRLRDVKIPFQSLVLAGDCQWGYTVNDTFWDANFHNYDDRVPLLFSDGHAGVIQMIRGEESVDSAQAQITNLARGADARAA